MTKLSLKIQLHIKLPLKKNIVNNLCENVEFEPSSQNKSCSHKIKDIIVTIIVAVKLQNYEKRKTKCLSSNI